MKESPYSFLIVRIVAFFSILCTAWIIVSQLFVLRVLGAASLGPVGQVIREFLFLGLCAVFLGITLRRIFQDVSRRERETRRSQDRLRGAVEAAGDGVWENNFMFATDHYSDKMFTMLGFDPVVPYDAFWLFQDRIHPDDRAMWQAANAAIQEPGNDEYRLIVRMRHKNGQWRHILSRGRCMERTPNGKPTRMVGTHTDVTEQSEREAELASTTQVLWTVLEILPSSLAVIDKDWALRLANRSWHRFAGDNDLEEVLARDVETLDSGELSTETQDLRNRHKLREAVRSVLSGEQPEAKLAFTSHGTGTESWAEIVVLPFRIEADTDGAIVIANDITDRHIRDDALQTTVAILEHVVHTCPLAILTLDKDRQAKGVWNPAAGAVFGWTGSEVLGKRLPMLSPEFDVEFQDLCERGDCVDELHVHCRRRDGKPVEVALWARPVPPSASPDGGFVLFMSDISERMRQETILLATKNELEQIFKHLPFAVLLIDPQTRTVHGCSPSVASEFGYTREWLTGQTTRILYSEEAGYRESEVLLQTAVGTGQLTRATAKMKRKDGRDFDAALIVVPVDNPADAANRIMLIVQDLTELGTPAALLRSLLWAGIPATSNLSAMFYRCANSQDLMMEFVSEGAREVTGYAPEAFTDGSRCLYQEIIHQPDRADIVQFVRNELARKGRFEVRYRIRTAADEIRWVNHHGVLVPAGVGNAESQEGIITDVTSDVRAREALIQYRQHLQWLVFQATLAGGRVREDIARRIQQDIVKNLASIGASIQDEAKRSRRKSTAETWRRVNEGVEAAIEHCNAVTSELCPPILDQLGLGPALEEMVRKFKAQHGLATSYTWSGSIDRLDKMVEKHLYQFSEELLQNVVQHAGVCDAKISVHVANGRVRVMVEDEGRGFPNDSPAAEGTRHQGCGLSLIRECAVHLGGACTIATKPGVGSRVSIEIPTHPAGPVHGPGAPDTPSATALL